MAATVPYSPQYDCWQVPPRIEGAALSRIFLSYRREDTLPYAGRLFDNLRAHFGNTAVFMDIDTIQPGADFVAAIEEAVGSSAAVLVLIGPQWLNMADSEGRRRLDNPNDFVRLEVAAALRRNVRVVPVLLHGARMPTAEELPRSLNRLWRLNAFELHDARWRQDVELLIAALEDVVPPPPPIENEQDLDTEPFFPPPRRFSWNQPRMRAVGAGAALLVAVLVATIALRAMTSTAASDTQPLPRSPGGGARPSGSAESAGPRDREPSVSPATTSPPRTLAGESPAARTLVGQRIAHCYNSANFQLQVEQADLLDRLGSVAPQGDARWLVVIAQATNLENRRADVGPAAGTPAQFLVVQDERGRRFQVTGSPRGVNSPELFGVPGVGTAIVPGVTTRVIFYAQVAPDVQRLNLTSENSGCTASPTAR